MLLVCEELLLKLTFSLCCNENVCRYMYGMSANNMGLQMLLEKVPRSRKWRCLRSTQVWNRSKSFQPKSFSWHSRFPNHISISYWWIAFRKVCVFFSNSNWGSCFWVAEKNVCPLRFFYSFCFLSNVLTVCIKIRGLKNDL